MTKDGKTNPVTGRRKFLRGSRRELARVDYWHKLSESERDWLNKFNDEFVSGRFKSGEASLHSASGKRDCYNRNNRINRDITHKFREEDFELD